MPQRTTDEIITLVRTNILFRGVSNRTIAKLAHKFVKQAVKAGEIIFDESTAGREIYLICSGRVRIRKYTRYSPEATLALLHPGDFFGELSVIDELQRSARAEAVEDSVIVRLDAAEFREMIRTSYAFTFNLLNNLAIRLRSIDKVFIQEMERNALAAKTKMDRLNSLIEASKTVNSTIEIDRLLTLIVDAAARSISADRGTLYLLDRSTNELWSMVTQGENMVEIRLPAGKGLAGYVAQTGDVVNIPDAYKDPRFNPEIDRKTGYKTYNVLCMPMRDKEGRIVGVFQFLNKESGPFTDDDAAFIDALSVHAAIAVENARIAAEMVRTERLSAVGRMASSIIHDIKNPMGALRMYAQIIKTKTDNKEAARIADEMIRQVDRFVSMTQEILDFSRGISEMHVEEVPVKDVVEACLKVLEGELMTRKIALVRNYHAQGTMKVDPEKIVRVFHNLAGNAADAMPKGGELLVTTQQANGNTTIEFRDTGHGMSDEVKARVFEPFFTAGKRHGTGLGMSIVKKIIDDHHGRIEIDSEPDKGTTVRLILP